MKTQMIRLLLNECLATIVHPFLVEDDIKGDIESIFKYYNDKRFQLDNKTWHELVDELIYVCEHQETFISRLKLEAESSSTFSPNNNSFVVSALVILTIPAYLDEYRNTFFGNAQLKQRFWTEILASVNFSENEIQDLIAFETRLKI